MRCQLFGSTRTLLETAGVGAVRPLAPSLLAAACAELYGRKQAAQQEGDGAEGPARKKARKGKQAAVAPDFAGEAAAGVDGGVTIFGQQLWPRLCFYSSHTGAPSCSLWCACSAAIPGQPGWRPTSYLVRSRSALMPLPFLQPPLWTTWVPQRS